MKSYSVLVKRIALRVTPFVTTWVLASAPGLAATLAGSYGELFFTDFSQQETSALEAVNDADGFAESRTDDSVADFDNFSSTIAEPSPLNVSNVAESLVFGNGPSYTASATTSPRYFANFDVSRNDTLSFNFTAFLDLNASVDQPGVEYASAAGDISFYLLDTTGTSADQRLNFLNSPQFDPTQIGQNNVLDSFMLAASIDATGQNNFINNTSSGNITFNSNSGLSSFGPIDGGNGSEAYKSSSVEGSVSRSFKKDSNITLLAFKNTKSNVEVPEPENVLGSVLFAGLLVVAMRARKKAQNKSSS
ncbi:hypothetical protein [Mastigocoleus testarum]|uniref:PEP-CTERM sorting domain-containing protein n=1 Tax=Mastigocoleus testarum BC008 TaxID=371196 RepID=A0A0V7ZBZ5_9CYAN|nr:hypothetical protein [Mastigocoleus testarum]KST62036.1 hypothetical protein BC008_08360 [Mastigocoleus testarum BC008]KST62630.1 hypothetical protein BC008_38000 [Mastigocoleus testarum BC008]